VNLRGLAAERLAASYLVDHGLVVSQRNYRCRYGEIDIIARDGATLVFVEVRQRATDSFGGAAESITAAKRIRLVAAARHYLARLRKMPPCRFDAVLVQGQPPRVEWIRNAFGE
jgi:putative endonuclease